ncbi:MAG TPA: MFS transporter [Polyangia bacterium]|jgi:MFS family permease
MAEARRLSHATVPGPLAAAATTWVVASQLAVVYVLSTLPTPLYAVYREAFGFSALTLTFVYAAYVVGTLSTMLFAGRLSDQVGRRPVTLASIGIAAAATVLFLVARDTAWLFAARIVSGCAVALVSGASTAWIVEAHPTGDRRAATQIAIGANLIGLGVGPLLAGLLAQYAPAPLRLAYVVLLPVLAAAFTAVWLGRETVKAPTPIKDASLRPRIGVPGEVRSQFLVAAVAAFATFSVMGFYSALLPGVLEHALHDTSRATAGAIAGGMFLIAAVTVAIVDLEPARGLIAGLVILIAGVGAMVLAEHARSMALLLAATGAVGVASGLGYRFGVQLVNELSPGDRRSEVVSAYLIVCYVAISLPVIGVGIVSAATSPLIADTIFGALVALVAAAALVIELVLRRRRR